MHDHICCTQNYKIVSSHYLKEKKMIGYFTDLRSKLQLSCCLLIICFLQIRKVAADDFPTCLPKDFHYEFTECDDSNGRWRVSVPKPHICVGGAPNPPLRVKCGISCGAGTYYNSTGLSCSLCPPGTYSLGGAVRFENWDPIPEEFKVETSPFSSQLFNFRSDSKQNENCTTYGWHGKSWAISSFGGPCVSTLSFSVKLVKPGYVSYTYQYTDKSVLFSFKAQNDQCHTISESRRYRGPPITRKNQWKTIKMELKAGLNVLYWKTMGLDASAMNQPTLIKEIEVMGVAYTSKCTKCKAGTFNKKKKADYCETCPRDTYSPKGSTECLTCDKQTKYAEKGSSKCLDRPACTQSDYNEYNSPCNEKKQTKTMYKWSQPKICLESVSGSVKLPVSGVWKDCPPCNPGMSYSKNSSNCVFCAKNTYSDGSSECKTCPVSTAPNYGYQFKWWHSLPPHMEQSCVDVQFLPCHSNKGWEPQGDFIKTTNVNRPDSYLVLSLDVPGFGSNHIRSRILKDAVGHIDFEFETRCSSDCEFSFLMASSVETAVIEKWTGSNYRQHFRYVVHGNDTYSFSWAFRKLMDESELGLHSSRKDLKRFDGDFAKIYLVNVTGSIDGGASTCLNCPKGTKDNRCILCPAGQYISEEDSKCITCPTNTYMSSHGIPVGNESCKACGSGLRSENGQTCYSDCRVSDGQLQHYDFSALPKYVLVKGQALFSSSGTKYFHSFNISLCGEPNVYAECSDNVTAKAFDFQSTVVVRSHVCRSTLIPVEEHGSVSFSSTMSASLGDTLLGISTSSSYKGINVTKAFLKGNTGKDIHFFYRSPEVTHACKSGRSTTITLRCDRSVKGNGTLSVPPSCGDGTCDGCNYHFLWATRLACPVCTHKDYVVVKGECESGLQKIHYIPPSYCLLPDGSSEPLIHSVKCRVIPQELQLIIGLSIGCGILLLVLVIYFWKKNRKLEYKYMKLVQSSSSKEGELPVAESCGIEDDEYAEEDGYENVEYNKGKGLLGKIRAMTGSTNKAYEKDAKWGTEGKWTNN